MCGKGGVPEKGRVARITGILDGTARKKYVIEGTIPKGSSKEKNRRHPSTYETKGGVVDKKTQWRWELSNRDKGESEGVGG